MENRTEIIEERSCDIFFKSTRKDWRPLITNPIKIWREEKIIYVYIYPKFIGRFVTKCT